MADEKISPERFNDDGFEGRLETQIQQRRAAIIPNMGDILNMDRIERLTSIIRGERENLKNPPKIILFEKNLSLIRYKKAKKDSRLKIMQYLINSGVDVKSNLDDDITADITSLENIDFNGPCTLEQKEELKKQFDYYVYKDCADEINCEIKTSKESNIDINRLNYFNQDPISEEISEHFKSTNFERLPQDYDEQVLAKTNAYVPTNLLKRRVLVEKINYPTHTKMARYDAFIKSAREMGGGNFSSPEVQEYRNAPDFLIERIEVVGDLRRMLFGGMLVNNGR